MSTSTNAANDPRTQELPFYDATGNEIMLQYIMSLGTHGAHSF